MDEKLFSGLTFQDKILVYNDGLLHDSTDPFMMDMSRVIETLIRLRETSADYVIATCREHGINFSMETVEFIQYYLLDIVYKIEVSIANAIRPFHNTSFNRIHEAEAIFVNKPNPIIYQALARFGKPHTIDWTNLGTTTQEEFKTESTGTIHEVRDVYATGTMFNHSALLSLQDQLYNEYIQARHKLYISCFDGFPLDSYSKSKTFRASLKDINNKESIYLVRFQSYIRSSDKRWYVVVYNTNFISKEITPNDHALASMAVSMN